MFKRITVLASVLFCAQALTTLAANPKELPAETKWVLNLDMKAAQTAPMLTFVADKMAPEKRQEAENKLAAIKAMFGVDLLKDIDQVVIAGTGNAEKGGVAYVYGTFDVQRLTTILAGSKNFASTQYGAFTILGWNDDGQKYVSFAKPGIALLTNSQTALNDALDVLGGKKPGLAGDSVFAYAFARTGQELLTVQAVDVPNIVGEQPKAQALKQAQSLCLRVSAASPEELTAALSVTASSDETATQIQQALMGIQALTLLRANEEPESASLASLAKVAVQGRTVSVTVTLPKSTIENIMRLRQQREAAKAAQPAAPAAAAPAATN